MARHSPSTPATHRCPERLLLWIYIYTFLVQQMLAMWRVQRWGVRRLHVLIGRNDTSLAVTSWWLIEKRALMLRRIEPGDLIRRLGLAVLRK